MSERITTTDIRPLSDDENRRLNELTAALPERIAPERDLWPDIDARIAPARRPWQHFAAAASVLVAFGAIWIWRMDQGVVTPPMAGGAVPEVSAEFTRHVEFTPVFLRTHEQSLEQLSDLLDELPPASRKVIIDNLKTIRASIAAINDAVEREPNNRELQLLLRHAYEQELALLEVVRETTEPLLAKRTDI